MRIKTSRIIFFLICLLTICYACNSKKEKPPTRLDFTPIKGIRYFEVKRRFSDDLSFNKTGFQLEPSWIIEFLSNDSVSAWSPDRTQWYNFLLTYAHGNVYNFAREYVRIKSISKDSIIMQRLEVRSKEIALDYRSDVNITYYSKDYIFKTLKTNPEVLQRPSRQDTAFIKLLAERSNRNPSNLDSAFAARETVLFTPRSKSVTAIQKKSGSALTDRSVSFNYLYPEYRITINGAYKDFAYPFSAIVDAKGNFYITKVEGILPGDAEPRKKVVQGIADVYLKNLFKITPGTTLGIPHSSEINIVVVGKKGK